MSFFSFFGGRLSYRKLSLLQKNFRIPGFLLELSAQAEALYLLLRPSIQVQENLRPYCMASSSDLPIVAPFQSGNEITYLPFFSETSSNTAGYMYLKKIVPLNETITRIFRVINNLECNTYANNYNISSLSS